MAVFTESAQAFVQQDYENAQTALGVLLEASSTNDERALWLHLRALVFATTGQLDDASVCLEEAAALEREAGRRHGGEHTTHQIVLLKHLEGDIKRTRDYYKDTFRTLYGMKNKRGMALCLRSLGEMALLHNKPVSATSCWSQAVEHFEALELTSEVEGIRAWMALLKT